MILVAGDSIAFGFGVDDDELQDAVVRFLHSCDRTLSTAEFGTGGMVAPRAGRAHRAHRANSSRLKMAKAPISAGEMP